MSQHVYTEAVCDRCRAMARIEGNAEAPQDWGHILTRGPEGAEFLLCPQCFGSFGVFIRTSVEAHARRAALRSSPLHARRSEIGKTAVRGRPRDAHGRLLPRIPGGPPAILDLLRTGPASSTDLAKATGMPSRTVLRYLSKLFDGGQVGYDPGHGWMLSGQHLPEAAPAPEPALEPIPAPFWTRPQAPPPAEVPAPSRLCASKRYQSGIALFARCARPAGHAGRHRHLRVILASDA